MQAIDLALAACDAVESSQYASIARSYGVDRTTLSCRHRRLTSSKTHGRDQTSFLTIQQELELMQYINKLTANGLPPTNSMVSSFAANVAHKQPGKNWVSRFINCHKSVLKSAYLEGLDLSRKRADNVYLINHYFDMIEAKITQNDIQPYNIYNTDEKGFLLGILQKIKRILTRVHADSGKLQGSGQDGSREWITLVACICMDGTALPPSIIY